MESHEIVCVSILSSKELFFALVISAVLSLMDIGGKVGGPFAGSTLLLLTSTGAKSGKRRVTPLVYLADGERLIIFASKAGAPTNPDWYHNLLAHPTATVEVGTESFAVNAVELHGAERDEIFARQARISPQFAHYQANTSRKIPVIALERQK